MDKKGDKMNWEEIVVKQIMKKHKIKKKDIRFRVREDKRIEWICPHDIGHTVWYPEDSSIVHGCDGCCEGIEAWTEIKIETETYDLLKLYMETNNYKTEQEALMNLMHECSLYKLKELLNEKRNHNNIDK